MFLNKATPVENTTSFESRRDKFGIFFTLKQNLEGEPLGIAKNYFEYRTVVII